MLSKVNGENFKVGDFAWIEADLENKTAEWFKKDKGSAAKRSLGYVTLL